MQRKIIFLLTIITACIIFFSQCISFNNESDPRGKMYAGSSACNTCHQQICGSYLQTAHYHSAGPANLSFIPGSFSKGSNSFSVNDSTKIIMEKRGAVPYQVLYINGKEKRSERFDIIFGYAKGQSYLYWKNDLLFQLPVSYFTNLHSWTSSPGYPPGQVFFDRPIYERCFECHTSYIKTSAGQQAGLQNVKALDKTTLIYDIDCERCHGPAANHVNFHNAYPEEKQGRYIISYKSLSRAQKIDMCAVCHSGNKNFMLRSVFAFMPGDTLSHFMLPDINAAANPATPDVHGNQAALLAMSKCFIMSNMDCSTCHNTHINDRGNYIRYAQRCQGCHTIAGHNFCKMADSSNMAFLKNNCTRCHMPGQPSNVIMVKTAAGKINTPVSMINHRIAIYPVESKKIIDYMKENGGIGKK